MPKGQLTLFATLLVGACILTPVNAGTPDLCWQSRAFRVITGRVNTLPPWKCNFEQGHCVAPHESLVDADHWQLEEIACPVTNTVTPTPSLEIDPAFTPDTSASASSASASSVPAASGSASTGSASGSGVAGSGSASAPHTASGSPAGSAAASGSASGSAAGSASGSAYTPGQGSASASASGAGSGSGTATTGSAETDSFTS